jgi:hypothetical protein
MTFAQVKNLHPQLIECRFEKYLLLCEGTIIKFAFEFAYLNTDKVGSQHLHTSCLTEIQNLFNQAKQANLKPIHIIKTLLLF